MTPGLTWYSLNDNNFKTKKQLFGTTKAVDVIFSSHLKSATSQPTQNRSFRRRSSQPISWLSRPIEKTKPNTTKGNLQEKQKYIICVVQNEHTKSHAWPPLTNGTSGLETKLIYCCNQPRSQSQKILTKTAQWLHQTAMQCVPEVYTYNFLVCASCRKKSKWVKGVLKGK